MGVALRKPSLHEIAAMPFSQTVETIRKFYDPAWGKTDEEGEPIKAWRVQFKWTIEGDFDRVIEADTEDEATEKAKEWVYDDTYSGHLDIRRVVVMPAKAEDA